MVVVIVLLVLLGQATLLAQPSTAPTTAPANEFSRQQLPDGRTAVLTREERTIGTDSAGHVDTARLFVLRLIDPKSATVAVLWLGANVLIGTDGPSGYPALVQVAVQGDIAIVVYNQLGYCFGDIMRWKAGAEPERVLTRVRVMAETTADFGASKESASISGSFSDGTLRVTVTDAQKQQSTYRLDLKNVNRPWVFEPPGEK